MGRRESGKGVPRQVAAPAGDHVYAEPGLLAAVAVQPRAGGTGPEGVRQDLGGVRHGRERSDRGRVRGGLGNAA